MVQFLWLLAVSWKGLYFIKSCNRRLWFSPLYFKEQSFHSISILNLKWWRSFPSKNCTVALTFIMVLTKDTEYNKLCNVCVH